MSVSGQDLARITKAAARAAVLLLAMVMLPASVQAVTVSGLYSVEVPVAGSAPAQLREGYAEGLRRVLVRVSGSRDVLTRDGVQALLDQAESLLQAYQFLHGTDGRDRLQMTFGAVAVNRALASIEAPVWGANRPLTLVWAAVEEMGSRRLLTRDETGDARVDVWLQALHQAARERGLPVALPPYEFRADRSLLSEIWGQFTERVRAAASGIPHDAMALVRISRSGGQWRAGWVFDGMGLERGEETLTAATPEALMQALVDRWADQFANRYAVAAGDVGELPQVDIVLQGVATLTDYAEATAVLRELAPIRSVGAVRVRGEQLTLRATFTGELDQLKEYMALDARFIPLAGAPAVPEAAAGAGTDTLAGAEEAGPAGREPSPELEPFAYQTLPALDAEAAEQSFGSLYQVLYYRWQPAPVTATDPDV